MTDNQRIQNALAHHRAGRLREAEKIYRGILDRDPDHLDALNLLGALEGQMGHREVAVELISRVLRIRPDLAIAHNNLGVNLKDLGRYDEAIAALRRCLEITPEYADGYNNLGLTLDKNKQTVEAIAAFRRALELDPNLAQANCNLANVLLRVGDSDEAIALHRRAMQLNREYPDAQSDLVYALQFQADCDAQAIFQEHRRWDQLFGEPLGKLIKPHANDPNPNRKLRIGYVSADFFYHSVSQFFLPLLRCHDHQRFEITCYSGTTSPDQMTKVLRASADRWVDTAALNDHELAEKIRQDQIDILVDLSGHTGTKRLRTFAEKPAPVQVTYLGYPATTGLSTIDYRITDALADPPGKTEAFHSEQLVRMPVSNWCYFAPPLSPPVKPAPDRPVCFGTFNNFSKASPMVRDLWIEILKAVPSSRLMLKSSGLNERPIQDKIRGYFVDRGVTGDRIELYGHTSDWTTHLGLYDQLDISVDTFPYHGTTTTCEAMWMGVPVVTLAGENHVSRVGVSLLTNMGLQELIAQTPGEYVSIAVALANDSARRAELRRTLRPRMRKSPLMDGVRLARDLEAAYRRMWQTWCGTRAAPPVSLHSQLQDALSHHTAGRISEAEALYRKILEQKPDEADALHLLGVLLFHSNRRDPSREMITRAITINPSSADYHRNLGSVLLEMGQPKQALDSFQSALKLREDFAEAHAGAGQAFAKLGDQDQAIEHLRRAVELSPESPDVLRTFADALQHAGRHDQAIEQYRRLIEKWPDDIVARNNLATSLLQVGQTSESIAVLRQALDTKADAGSPNRSVVHGNLLFALNYSADVDPREIFAEHRAWSERYADSLSHPAIPFARSISPQRRLRIGYVSSDFSHHPVGHFILPLFENRDKSGFETFCYAAGHVHDDLTGRIKRACDVWRDIANLGDHEAAEVIESDAIDILVDLSGHTAGNRLGIFARKPAPIQVTYLGYPNTTGMRAIDYRLTDFMADPPGMTEALGVESLQRLQHCAWCFQRPEFASEVEPRDPGPITFGCFGAFAKINPQMVASWAKILEQVPESRLLIKSAGAGEASAKSGLIEQFTGKGVAAERIDLMKLIAEPREHLRLYHRVDVALDTYPYNGTTTTCEALWMGVPVVTLAGTTHVSRVGASLLSQIGLANLVAESSDRYISIAVSLANDRDRLAELRRTLRQRMATSPLMDGGQFARDVEAAYREMWRKWCESREKAANSVDLAFAQSTLKEALSQHQAGRLAEAESLYQKILARNVDHADALHLLGVLLFQSNRREPARRMIARAIEINSSSPDFYRNFGLVLLAMGENRQALKSFESALKLRENFGDAHAGAGQALVQMGNFDQAVEHLRRATELSPNSPEILRCFADGLLQAGRYDQAIAEYRRLLAKWPGDSVAKNNLTAAIAKEKLAGVNQVQKPK